MVKEKSSQNVEFKWESTAMEVLGEIFNQLLEFFLSFLFTCEIRDLSPKNREYNASQQTRDGPIKQKVSWDKFDDFVLFCVQI